MSYIGAKELKASDIRRFDVTGSTSATHTLTWTAPTEQSLIVTINGVKQQEDAYSVSGTTLTLTSALVSTDKLEVIGINDIGTTITPAQNSVTADTIADDAVTVDKIADDAVTVDKLNLISTGSVPSLEAKGTSGVTDGYIQLNCAENSHGIKLKSPPHSAGASYTLIFPNNDGDDGQTLTTDGSGVLTWAAAGGDNTPSFYAYLSASQSISTGTWTKCNLNAEEWDTDSAFDSSTYYRFTVPSGKAGKYNFSYGTRVAGIDDNEQVAIALYKNGSALTQGTDYRYSPGGSNGGWPRGSVNLNLSVADYIELWVYHDEGASQDATSEHTFLTAFKLIGV